MSARTDVGVPAFPGHVRRHQPQARLPDTLGPDLLVPELSALDLVSIIARHLRVDLVAWASFSMTVMEIKAVLFDIGGVLEITPDLGLSSTWESRLGLAAGAIGRGLADVWAAGSIGAISEDAVHQALANRLGLGPEQVAEFMGDLWREYLGTLNTELIDYARELRPRYRTGIISNSFAGAREREQSAYQFAELVDEIVYSHECGMSKPDPGIYALACDRVGAEPAQTVFLDDVEAHVAGARRAGLNAVRYQDNAQAIRDLVRLLAG